MARSRSGDAAAEKKDTEMIFQQHSSPHQFQNAAAKLQED